MTITMSCSAGLGCLTVNKHHIQKMRTIAMMIARCMHDNILMDGKSYIKKNDHIQGKLKVAHIEKK